MEEIKQNVNAYSDQYKYMMDIELMMDYYPKRIIQMASEGSKVCLSEKSFLELGIGHGKTTEIFKHYFKDYTILDGDAEIIAAYQKKHQDSVRIIHTFFEEYEESLAYDIIVAGFVMEHVEDPGRVLTKYKSYLKDEGRMYIAVPNAEALNRRVGHFAGLLPDMTKLSQSDLDLGHKRYYTVNTIKEECIQAGLKICRVEGIYLKPLTTAQMESLHLSQNLLEAFCQVGKDFPELCVGILLECVKE